MRILAKFTHRSATDSSFEVVDELGESMSLHLSLRAAGLLSTLILKSFAQSPSGSETISGTVLDPQGRAVPFAAISVNAQGAAKAAASTKSDASGHFLLSVPETGQCRILVSAEGFENASRSISLAQAIADLEVRMEVRSLQSTVTVRDQMEGFVAPQTSVGSRFPAPILDLPQSVEVVNRTLLDEQKVFQFADALSYLPGVQRAYTTIAGSIGNEVSMRGFQLDYNNNYLRDGFKYPGTASSDTADIEAVEVLKGPASALYGTAEAGGVVNLVSKKPTETPSITLGMTGGSFQFLRPEFDISGPANKRRTIYYRLNGVYENTQSFRDFVKSEKYLIAPYFLWKPNSSTSLAVLGEITNIERVSDYGTVILGNRPAPVSSATNYTEPWNNEVDRDRQLGYRFNHSFRSNWTVTNDFQLSRTNPRYLEVYTNGPATDPLMLARLSDKFYFPALYRYSQTNLFGTVKTGPVTHHVAAGFEAGWINSSSKGPGGFAPDVSVLHPVVGTYFSIADAVSALANPFFNLTYETVIHTQAGYLQDQVDLGAHWKAIAGFRAERYFQDSIDLSQNNHQRQVDVPVSPRAGLVYQPSTWISLYASYVRSFIPTNPSAIKASGKQFSPEHDWQFESGVKLLSSSSRLSVTAAFFDIKKTNVLAPDPANQLFLVQNGRERSKGAEFEFRGTVRPGWNLLTSYSFIQAQVIQSTEFPIGNILPNAPRNSGALWTTYAIPAGWARGFGVSAGLVATSARQDNFYNSAQLPGYARLDLGSYYDFKTGEKQTTRFSLNIQNALDRTYYLASNGSDQVRPGSPISVLASVRWTLR